MIKYTILLILPFFLMSCTVSKKAEDVSIGEETKNEITFTEQLDKALEDNKIVFIDFYTDWCLPCKMMDEEVFSDRTISEFFESNFINVKVDAEKGEGPDLTVIYEVKRFPTLIFVDQKGRVLLRKEGLTYHNELRQFAEHAISIWENQ